MALLFNSWFNSGGTPKDFSRLDANGVGYSPVTDAVLANADVALRCFPTTAPDGSGESVYKFTKFAADTSGGAGPKVQLAPAATTANKDPISSWVGSSASRRWYRFKVCLPVDFQYEYWQGSSQRMSIFQVHDTVDTTPADYDVSPPLWLIMHPDGSFWFDVTSVSDTQTTSSNFTVRSLAQCKLKPGVAYEFVVFVRWAWDNTGAMAIWQNRRKIWDETGIANCHNDDPTRGGSGVFSILTCYCHDDVIDQSVCHWGLQIGDETYGSTSATANYNAFATACGAGSELERTIADGVAVG